MTRGLRAGWARFSDFLLWEGLILQGTLGKLLRWWRLGWGTLLSFFLGGSGSPRLGEPILPCFVSEAYTLAELRACGGDGAGTVTGAEPLERFMSPR